MAWQRFGAGTADRMALVTGFPVFLHTPCGMAPRAFTSRLESTACRAYTAYVAGSATWFLAPLEHPLGGLHRPELFGSLGCAVWQHSLQESTCSPHAYCPTHNASRAFFEQTRSQPHRRLRLAYLAQTTDAL